MLDLGPILRAMTRRKGSASLLVLEVAFAFVVISCLVIASDWYLKRSARTTKPAESDLILLNLLTASGDEPGDASLRERALLADLDALPSVFAASPVSSTLMDNRPIFPTRLQEQGRTGGPVAFGWTVQTGPRLEEILVLPPLFGKWPRADDTADIAAVTVLTRCLAEDLFGEPRSALGKTITVEDSPPARVVAVVENQFMRAPFLPRSACVSFRFGRTPNEREARYLIKARPGRRTEALAAVAARVGPSSPRRLVELVLYQPETAADSEFVSGIVLIFVLFAAKVVVLTLLATVAVSSFLVAERRRSIGIRRALGATRADIARYFLVESSLSTAMGIALGLGGILLFLLLMRRVFPNLEVAWYGLGVPAVVLWINATVAALLPARKAASIPPWVASRGPSRSFP